MMKKGFLMGLVLGLLIGSVSAVGAASEYIQAKFAKYNLVINGQQVEVDSDPIVYQGTTYFPFRWLLNTLGYDVTYLTDSRTIVADKTVDRILQELDAILPEESEGDIVTDVPNIETDEKVYTVFGRDYRSIDEVDEWIRRIEMSVRLTKSAIENAPEGSDTSVDEKVLLELEEHLRQLQELRQIMEQEQQQN